MAELISIREYGRRHGCSDTNVHKAIKNGRIVEGLVVKDGKKYIDPEIADREWAGSIDPDRTFAKGGGRPLKGGRRGDPNTDTLRESTGGDGKGLSHNDAKRIKLIYDAQIAKLNYEEKAGSLISKKEVYNALFVYGQRIREAMLGIPARVVDDIMASNSRHEAMTILDNAIRSGLEALSEAEDGSLKLKQ